MALLEPYSPGGGLHCLHALLLRGVWAARSGVAPPQGLSKARCRVHAGPDGALSDRLWRCHAQ